MFSEMCKTRAAFKLALRYCRRHADQLKADGMAGDLLQQSSNNKFWKNVSRTNAQKINKYATVVGDAAGEHNICHMRLRIYLLDVICFVLGSIYVLHAVKCVFFKTYCLCFYNIALWRNYTVTCLNRFKASYHRCVKKFFGLP